MGGVDHYPTIDQLVLVTTGTIVLIPILATSTVAVVVAVIVAVPVPAGVMTPELLTDPMLVGLTDHVTDEL